MKHLSTPLTLFFALLLGVVAQQGCSKAEVLDSAYIVDAASSGCHNYYDSLSAKEVTDADSIAVTLDGNSLTVEHRNLMLDCGSGEQIRTTLQQMGDTLTVVESVGEQGRTNCICAYDNTFHIANTPQRPFTLQVALAYNYLGTPDTVVLYQHTF